MKKQSKRFTEVKKIVDPDKVYTISEAIELAKKTSTTKFDSGLEVHIRFGIDPKKADQVVRSSVVLPHGTGKKKKIAVFAEGKDQEAAKKAGAEIVGGEELIAEIKKTGKCDFEVALATPEMMKKMGQIARILGPKGLMPNPRSETVIKDVAQAVKDLSEGKITFRNDDSGNIHQLVGKISFESKDLEDNINTFLDAVKSAKPTGIKGAYIISGSLCTTMGPSIKINI